VLYRESVLDRLRSELSGDFLLLTQSVSFSERVRQRSEARRSLLHGHGTAGAGLAVPKDGDLFSFLRASESRSPHKLLDGGVPTLHGSFTPAGGSFLSMAIYLAHA
jgi:hypothetical protein